MQDARGVQRGVGGRHATEELLLRGSGADVVQMALLQVIATLSAETGKTGGDDPGRPGSRKARRLNRAPDTQSRR
eukprot:g25408.t1